MLRRLPWLWPLLLAAIEVTRQWVGDTTAFGFFATRLSEPAWLAGSLVALLICLLVQKWRSSAIPFAVASLVAAVMIAPIIRQTKPIPKGSLKVMQLNMQHGLTGIEKVAALIERESPDILCLQESGPRQEFPDGSPPPIRRALRGYVLYRSFSEAIAVKGEILGKGTVELPEPAYESAIGGGKVITFVKARIRGKVIRIATVHLSPRPDPSLSAWAGAAQFARIRQAQFKALADFLKASPEHTILCGDFNSHPVGPNYRLMTSIMTDAFAAAGSGIGYTMNSRLPHKRIDYIYCRGFVPVAHRVLPDVVSDHRAVVAWLK